MIDILTLRERTMEAVRYHTRLVNCGGWYRGPGDTAAGTCSPFGPR